MYLIQKFPELKESKIEETFRTSVTISLSRPINNFKKHFKLYTKNLSTATIFYSSFSYIKERIVNKTIFIVRGECKS